MKFDAQQFLDKHQGDSLKALNALHREVEDREAENYEERKAKRKALQDLKELQDASSEGTAKADTDLLARYQKLGTPEELEGLSDKLETATEELFKVRVKAELVSAGVSPEKVDRAVRLIEANAEEYLSETDDAVTLDVTKFKKEFPEFLSASSTKDSTDDSTEDDGEDTNEDEEDTETTQDDTTNQDATENDTKTQQERTVRVVGGKRNKEKQGSANLASVSKQLGRETAYIPAVLRAKEN